MIAPRRTEAGVATIWTIGVAAGCLLMVGLVLDGGRVLRERSTAFDLAGGAARAAAQELDEQALAQGRVTLNPDAARATARAWLAAHDTSGDVAVEADTVTVTVRQTVRLQILRPAQVTVDETATAQAQRGSEAQ